MRAHANGPARQRGFTIIELLVTLLIVGLITAMVAPNLRAFVPKARLDAAAKVLTSNVDFLRSESRIMAKRCSLELDLKKARWRRVFPPEQHLTTDQDLDTLEPQAEDWTPLEDDVEFAGAGNTIEGFTTEGIFPMTFDENGFTADVSIFLRLKSDPKMVWTVRVRGLTGQCEVLPDYDGKQQPAEETGEGAF